MVKVGLVARAEDRGLGIIAWEAARHIQFDRVAVVEMGALARGFPPHLDRFPGATLLPFVGGTLDETSCRDWLAGLDVVLMLETAYDWRFIDWARDARVATVLYVMPEFWRDDVPAPDVVWNPTIWRHETLPVAARVVPVPVAVERFDPAEERTEGPVRILHNAGHRAAMDRNGTTTFLAALRSVVGGQTAVTVSGQDGRLPSARPGRSMTVTNRHRGSENYWDVPAGQDILVLPRRYGGLSLPVQEALAAGAVPVMPGCAPNPETWPIVSVPFFERGEIRTQGGLLPLAHAAPGDVAAAISALVADPDRLALGRSTALAWAALHSWEALGPLWADELARAAEILAARP